MLYIPNEIKEIIKNLNYKIDNIGRGTDIIIVFEDKYILKISKDKDRIYREKEKFDWLYNQINGSKSILIIEENEYIYYLRTYLKGHILCDNKFIDNPILLIEILKQINYKLRSLDDLSCPFKSMENEGNDFVHGDLCLPNIIVDDNNKFVGFIDIENCGKGDKYFDYSWLLWSFEYNLRTYEFNELLIKELKIDIDEDIYRKYIPNENIKMLGRKV